MSLFSRRECGYYHQDVEWPMTSTCPVQGQHAETAETAPEEGS